MKKSFLSTLLLAAFVTVSGANATALGSLKAHKNGDFIAFKTNCVCSKEYSLAMSVLSFGILTPVMVYCNYKYKKNTKAMLEEYAKVFDQEMDEAITFFTEINQYVENKKEISEETREIVSFWVGRGGLSEEDIIKIIYRYNIGVDHYCGSEVALFNFTAYKKYVKDKTPRLKVIDSIKNKIDSYILTRVISK